MKDGIGVAEAVDGYPAQHMILKLKKGLPRYSLIAIVATISHKRVMWEIASQRLSPFMEICLQCPVDVCASRDSKGVYSRAGSSSGEYVAGVTEPYEPSAKADLVLDTGITSIEECAAKLLEKALIFLSEKCGIFPGGSKH